MIERLSHLDAVDARPLIWGYESPDRYLVRRTESLEHIAFELERAPVPFTKRFPVPSDEMLGWYRGLLPDGLSFCARAGDGQMIALAIAGHMEWNNTVTLWEIHVDPAHRRKGIARALLEHVETAATSKGARRIWIETQNTNTPAIDFYRATGYAVVGLDLWYYTNDENGEIALFMQKPIS